VSILNLLAPFIGAIALEVVHWFQAREKLDDERYRRLLRSAPYWVITTLMVVVGGVGTLIYFNDRLEPGEMLVAGAAFPALLTKLVGTFTSRQPTTLGDNDTGSVVRDYFNV
jgi:hypothetical protein